MKSRVYAHRSGFEIELDTTEDIQNCCGPSAMESLEQFQLSCAVMVSAFGRLIFFEDLWYFEKQKIRFVWISYDLHFAICCYCVICKAYVKGLAVP